MEVARKSRDHYARLVAASEEYQTNSALQQRIHDGARYFFDKLTPIRTLLTNTVMPMDNKVLKNQLIERKQALDDLLSVKEVLLDALRTEPFTVTDYLKRKAKALLTQESKHETQSPHSSRSSRSSGRTKVEVPTEVQHPVLYQRLKDWRSEKSREQQLPAYCIIQQKALMGITNLLPCTPQALEAVPYFGAKGVEKYGDDILSIVQEYMKKRSSSSYQ
jgi:superfamily II DNA helicase RecQ